MTLIADIADALGITQKQARDEIGTAMAADAVANIIFERFWPFIPAGDIVRASGLTEDDIRSALVRGNDRRRREYAEQQRQRTLKQSLPNGGKAPRQDRTPVGKPPSKKHLWCKRGMHWVHRDDMAKNRHLPSGYGEWCKACWREYHATFVAPKRATKKAAAKKSPRSAQRERR